LGEAVVFYFPHIPKAGGTTLKQLFYLAFGTDKCMKVWNPDFGADYAVAEFTQLSLEDIERSQVILGHLPFATYLSNPNMEEIAARRRSRY
jgi:hypothetical protein